MVLLYMEQLQYGFQFYFTFLLYIIIPINYGALQDTAIPNTAYFLAQKCVNDKCCSEFRKLPGVICKNATDTTPSDLRAYNVNNTLNNIYELEFIGTKNLPEKIFHGQRLQFLFLNGPDLNVDKNVLGGIDALSVFDVQRSNIKEIPNFSHVKDVVTFIAITSSRLTSLDGENLQNLTSLAYMFFTYNSISSIDPDVFKGTGNVEILDLSHNLLTFIPEKLLDPMKNLIFFKANHNSLLHVDNLFSVTRPRYIHLHVNNITNVNALQISLETAQKVSRDRLVRCNESKIGNVENSKSLSDIEILDLSYNSLAETSRSIFPCYASAFFTYIPRIRTIKLIGNKLKNLSFLLKYTRIIKLQIPRNQIQYLTNEDFKLTSGIAYLDLGENEIKRIDTEVFKPIRIYPHFLDLSSNLIVSLNGSIRYLSQLRHLNLTRNFIESFAADEFAGLDELSELFLQHNQIKTIKQLQQLPRLRYLNIKRNDIDLIRPDHVPRPLKYMHLADNPFKYNCRLQMFIDRLNKSSIASDIDACSEPGRCGSLHDSSYCPEVCSCGCVNSENVSFVLVNCSSKKLSVVPHFLRNNLTEMEITFGYWRFGIMDQSIYSMFHIGDNVLRIVFENSSVESFETPRIPPNITHRKIYSKFYLRDNVLGINLENNSLESLEAVQFPPNLIQLYLSDNKLTSLPESILENQQSLKQVTLSGNPWKCDCSAIKFKKWLTYKKDIIQDIDNVRCGSGFKKALFLNGKVIWNLSDFDLCPTDVEMIASASSATLAFIIICLAAKVLYTKYELDIKVFLYSRGFTFIREEDLEHDKMFDAFVSFSHNDDEFVIKEIITVIEEKNPDIRLCLHYRHFVPGEFILKNILQAVQNSKRTLVILSEKFLESEWCILEFQTAHTQTMEDKAHRIIVVKIGDLPKKIDPSVKAYLDSTTYLTWGEKNFWNKLFYVLPSQSNIRNPIPNTAAGDNETACDYSDCDL